LRPGTSHIMPAALTFPRVIKLSQKVQITCPSLFMYLLWPHNRGDKRSKKKSKLQLFPWARNFNLIA